MVKHPVIIPPTDVSQVQASNILGFDANLSKDHPVRIP